MLKLYYSTNQTESFDNETQQTKVNNSLGGYISTSLIGSNTFGNLFSDVSVITGANERKETQFIAIYIKNEGTEAVTGINAWIEYTDETNMQSAIELAAVEPNDSGVIETVPDRYSQPMYATFATNIVTNKLVIGDLAADEKVGLWLKRTLDRDKIQTQYDDIVEVNPDNPNLVQSVDYGTNDTFSLKLEYDD